VVDQKPEGTDRGPPRAVRLFIALNFPESLRERWTRDTAPLRALPARARWLPTTQLHLTLAFLGEQQPAILDPLRAALDRVAASTPPLSLEMGGIGVFPTWRRPRVLWLGVDPAPLLMTLATAVANACTELGIAQEQRPFHPHITLARLADRLSPHQSRELERVARPLTGRTRAHPLGVDLMMSRPTAAGVTHELVHSAALR
jgi:RNA 2',3'-cyclic 3'-phosphodiesterase